MKLTILLTVFLGISTFSWANPAPIELVTGNDFPPYTDKTLKEGGLFTRIVKKVFEVEGVDFSLEWMSWVGGYERTVQANYNATFPYSDTPDREKYMYYSNPVLESEISFLVRKDEVLDFSKPELLKKAYVCKGRGYHKEDIRELEAGGHIKVYLAPDIDNCISMLASGRVSAVPIDRFVARFQVEKMRKNGHLKDVEFTLIGKVIHSSSLHFIISRKSPRAQEILKIFNRGLKTIKAKGEFDKVVEEYSVDNKIGI